MFTFISEKIVCFNKEASPENIKTQLLSFALNWNRLKNTISEDFEEDDSDKEGTEEVEGEEEESSNLENFGVSEKKKLCKNCLACVFNARFNVLHRYSLFVVTKVKKLN